MVQKKTRRILVPKPVSFSGSSKRGIQSHGTKASVKQGTRMPKGLGREEKYKFLQGLAFDSSHFIKPLSKKAKSIRQILTENGMRVERVVEDLKDGTALFEKEGFSLRSPEGKKIFAKNKEKYTKMVEGLVIKMHSLGIRHNHLHMGNIAITTKGELILLDLGRATISKSGRTTSREKGLNKFGREVSDVARALSYLCFPKSFEKRAYLVAEIVNRIREKKRT